MFCLVGKKGAPEDDLLWDTHPVKPIPDEITYIIKAPMTIDDSYCYIKYHLQTFGKICLSFF